MHFSPSFVPAVVDSGLTRSALTQSLPRSPSSPAALLQMVQCYDGHSQSALHSYRVQAIMP